MNCGGIILCGGRSSRMGLPKSTLPFGPEVMLARVVRLLAEAVQPIVVVAAPGQEVPDLPKQVILAHDQHASRGPLEGLRAGLSAIGPHADAAYATSCDVPLLVPDFVRRMIGLLGKHEIVVPKDGKFHHPLAAVYRTNVLPRIETLLAADRLRPFFLFAETDTREISIGQLQDVDPDLATLQNLNQPKDYLAALATAGFAAPPEVLEKLPTDE